MSKLQVGIVEEVLVWSSKTNRIETLDGRIANEVDYERLEWRTDASLPIQVAKLAEDIRATVEALKKEKDDAREL